MAPQRFWRDCFGD